MLKEEEQLYYLLIDILRSPYVLKSITGSSIREDEGDDDDNERARSKIHR